jgi:hypothetical protein
MVNTEMWTRMSQLSIFTERLRKLPIFRKKIIKACLTTGSLLQRRHALKLFLTDKRMVENTKSIMGDVVKDKNTIAA